MRICGKHFRYHTALPLQTQLRKTRSSGRSISKAVPCFRNLHVYEPALLEETSDSWKKPSDLRCSCTAKAIRKYVLNVGLIFLDAYCKPKQWSSCEREGGRGREKQLCWRFCWNRASLECRIRNPAVAGRMAPSKQYMH